MAERTPGEESVQRQGGPQVTAREARALAADEGTVRGPSGTGSVDREVPLDTPSGDRVGGGASRGASGGAGNASANERAVPGDLPFEHSEAALGGADTIQKTSWGVGHGTEPDGREEHAPVGRLKGEGDVVARVSPGGGANPIAWGVGIVALIALVAYLAGLFGS
jgi:hypothetical protein